MMTNDELTTAIADAIYDFSDTLRGLLEEAGRRLDEGQGNAALFQSSHFGARILAFIEHEKPKEKG
jgi:hypothetical protein